MRYACSTFGLVEGGDVKPPLKMASAVQRGYVAAADAASKALPDADRSCDRKGEISSWTSICTALLCTNMVLAEENGDAEAAAR